MELTLEPRSQSSVELRPLVQRILEEVNLCTMATVNRDGTAHVNIAFFCVDQEWRLFFVSSMDAQHSENIRERPSMAVAVCRSDQEWDDWKRGLQLFGRSAIARGNDVAVAAKLYKRRFPAYAKWLDDGGQISEESGRLAFYTFVPESVKLLYEDVLGEENLVTIALSRE